MYTATVEIGHTYAPDRLINLAGASEPGDFYSLSLGRAFNDTEEAACLREIADSIGESALRVALIDDVVVKQKMKASEAPWRWQHFLNACSESVMLGTGVKQSELFYESNFEQAGRDIVAEIQAMRLPEGYSLSRSGRRLIKASGFQIQLQGFEGIEDPSFPSCPVLDTAWLQKRLTLAPSAITVLPVSYRKQQEGASMLATLTGISSGSYVTVFV